MNITLDKYIKEYIDISLKLTSEKDYDQLFESLLSNAMDITDSDAGTIYRVTPEGLRFMVMRNNTLKTYQGGHGDPVDLPDVPLKEENICAYCAIHKKILNIPDVYYSDLFDFNGPKNFDAITRYRTQSMLVLPLVSHEDEVLGVMQLINAMDKEGNIIAYSEGDEYIVSSIAGQAAVSMANMLHISDMKELLDSSVKAFMTAQMEKIPYAAAHAWNVSDYLRRFAGYINKLHKNGETKMFFPEGEIEMLRMAGLLHDVGKLGLEKKLVEKNGRLYDRDMDRLRTRLDLIDAYMEIRLLSGKMDSRDYNEDQGYITQMINILLEVNVTDVLDDVTIKCIMEMADKTYTTATGKVIPYLTEEELNSLISNNGVFSEDELKRHQSHVYLGTRILKNIRFGKRYERVLEYVAKHHEYLDGSGYPEGLMARDIPLGARMIAIVNEYDNMTAMDRPYRKAMSKTEALNVLREMAEYGKLDSQMVLYFCKYIEGR